MARIVYTPEGAEPREFRFAPDEMQSVVLEDIEDVTGWTAPEWALKLADGSIKAMRAFLWVNLRETAPGLSPDSVQFTMAEITVKSDAGDEVEADPKASDSADVGTGN